MPDPILSARPQGFFWETQDPFLFCVHHDDAYPPGNERMGPAASLHGRDLGQDFEGRDGWRMYHGRVVPGFPQHPHRGFETVTLVRRGFVDHADSMGSAGRYGPGDVQWMTAGAGVVHSEMFPLVDRAAPNPAELFQIWLNLPPPDKMAPPEYTMLWHEQVPRARTLDTTGRATEVTLVAGRLGAVEAAPPPSRSWAARPGNDVAIWTLRLDPGASWTLAPAAPGSQRVLYLFEGQDTEVAGARFDATTRLELRPDASVPLRAGPQGAEFLLLQGRPIGAPVVQHGPFVMNTVEEIQRAFSDYQRTRFGGWPWPADDLVHARERGRFGRHADGRIELPPAGTP